MARHNTIGSIRGVIDGGWACLPGNRVTIVTVQWLAFKLNDESCALFTAVNQTSDDHSVP